MNKKEIAELEEWIKKHIHTFETYEGIKPTLENGQPTIACDYEGAVSMYDKEGKRVVYTAYDNSPAERFAKIHKTFEQIKDWLEVPAEERNTVSVKIESKGRQVVIETQNHVCVFDVSQTVYEIQRHHLSFRPFCQDPKSIDELNHDDLKTFIWYCLNECKGEWI
jgi:uncharacterized protein YxeA